MDDLGRDPDVLIVGTGVGGATLGYALASAGRSVLFLEQGSDLSGPECLRGAPPEARGDFHNSSARQRRDLLVRSGRNPEPYQDLMMGDSFVPFIGFGAGGSSSLYGMVLERRHAHDFEGWPVGYHELAPWYTQAENLYQVRGSADPLRPEESGCEQPATPLSLANDRLFAGLRSRGLHPYRLHVASHRVDGCRLCQGYLCDSGTTCKRDSRVTCLLPALATGNARLVENARVVRFQARGRRITEAVVDVNGRELRIAAQLFVSAAGALSSPRLLLRSGIANGSGLVGRRLMRHAIDLFVLTLGPRYEHAGESKELGLNDFYAGPGERLGTVQSFGMAPSLAYLRNQPGRNLWRAMGPAGGAAHRFFARAPVIAGILDDEPLRENLVDECGGTARVAYCLSPRDAARRRRLRRQILLAFARFGPIAVFGTTDRKALGHVCGTAVFGGDPGASVLNAFNRAHEIDNLFVVDGSFFPTSGGVNPALTIAANALRVADHVHREAL